MYKHTLFCTHGLYMTYHELLFDVIWHIIQCGTPTLSLLELLAASLNNHIGVICYWLHFQKLMVVNNKIHYLIGGLEHEFCRSIQLEILIPIGYLMFQRG